MRNKPDDMLTYESRWPILPFVCLLLVLAFSLATKLGLEEEQRLAENGAGDDDPIAHWLGDSRRLFAMSFYVKADAYFHSGYYPTIFDNNAPFKTAHIADEADAEESKNIGSETTAFGHPNNWIERFELNFYPTTHTHLDLGGASGPSGNLDQAAQVKEIMPWLKLSSRLDPNRIETYLVAAFWLRVRMHRVNDAEVFLREGLRTNPGNSAILYELAELYRVDRKQPAQARNLYLAALDSWHQENDGQTKPDKFLFSHIVTGLYRLEKGEGNTAKAIEYLKLLKTVSPVPDIIQTQIDALEQKSAVKP